MRVQFQDTVFSLQPWQPNHLHHPLNSELCLKLRAYLSKDSVLFVKPIAAVKSDEELTVVAMGSSGIGTSNHTSMIEPQTGMNLIRKRPPIDGISTCPNFSNNNNHNNFSNKERLCQPDSSHKNPDIASHLIHKPLACSSSCGIASLHHKSLDKPMKDGSIVVPIHTQLNEIANLNNHM
jgi:hypothetical protein